MNPIFCVVCSQVPLFNILKKFDGESITEVVRPRIARMKYRVTRLPQYMILHMRRFTKNNFFVEKNPTLGEYNIFLKFDFGILEWNWDVIWSYNLSIYSLKKS